MTTPDQPIKCRQCKSTDLVMHENRTEHGEWDGPLVLTESDEIACTGIGWFEAGEIDLKSRRIECRDCGHQWRPRRPFIGTVEDS